VEFFCDVLVYAYVSFITQVHTTLVLINFYIWCFIILILILYISGMISLRLNFWMM